MRRGYFLNFIIMQTEKQKKDFELIKRMGQDFMRKRNKENEERRRAEKRERNRYRMEVITFTVMALSAIYSCLSATLKQAWRWLLSLWSEWW